MLDQLPSPPPRGPAVGDLISVMENLRFLDPHLLADKHVTPLMCEIAFSVLVTDVLGVLEALKGLPAMAGRCMDDVFNHMLVAIRTPYLTELERLDAANRTLENDLLRKRTEHRALKAELLRVNNEHQTSKAELLRVNNEHQTSKAELLRVNNEHQTSKAEFLELKKKYQTYKTSSKAELLRLKNKYQTYKTSSKAEILREQTDHRTFQAELMAVNKQYQTTQSELLLVSNQHQKEVAQLNATIVGHLSDKQKMLRERTLGSVNRAQTWAKVVSKNPGMQDLDYPLLPRGAVINDSAVTDLENTDFVKEPEMYDPTFACLRARLTITDKENQTGCTVWDTHARRTLEGHSPDLTLSVVNTKRPDANSAIAVWELKVDALDDDGRGQVYDYLKIISKKQRHRSHFFGILSNLKDNILITLIRERRISHHGAKNWRWRCRSFKSMTLPYAIAFVHDIITHQRKYLPSMPAFSRELGSSELRLGSTTSSVVAAFQVPDHVRTKAFARTRWVNQDLITNSAMETFVVKRCVPAHGSTPERTIKSEIKILLRLHKAGVHRNLPEMVYYANDLQELAIKPWGYPAKPGDTLMDWRHLLEGVFEALKWLHSLNIIHRDVRWDNIICYRDDAVLIDFGASVYVPDDDSNTIYGGGNICCPPAMIGKFDMPYHPRPADDWYAFVLLVNTLNWPERWKDLRTDHVADQYSEVAIKLIAFWKQMARSKVWARYVVAAETADYEVLGEFLDCCVYFGAPCGEGL
ncbi:hypothetical protein Q9L58_009065 [Maublancomyces gigas]|uniref:Protein kinase domain-containing protein n=1 Tax=Discina gigas TaxID=1032678 RepID=A0ABR3G7Y4_9PEZI